HYAVLGLRRSAPLSSIRQRYRQRALLTHPDKNPASDAPAAFEMLREAHETLADAAKRKAYDR
ncbi:DnaJ domain-containing protein, partial [Pelagophyceae sp. CCMP2097]